MKSTESSDKITRFAVPVLSVIGVGVRECWAA